MSFLQSPEEHPIVEQPANAVPYTNAWMLVSLNSTILKLKPLNPKPKSIVILLMDKILHDLKDSKLWELWYIPYNG